MTNIDPRFAEEAIHIVHHKLDDEFILGHIDELQDWSNLTAEITVVNNQLGICLAHEGVLLVCVPISQEELNEILVEARSVGYDEALRDCHY